jgi:1,4-alpha-glucan branching enzyme
MPPKYAIDLQITRDINIFDTNDIYWFNEGTHYRLYNKLGCHLLSYQGVAGAYFAVWAPNADRVFVMGDFNNWRQEELSLQPLQSSGIWHGFVPGIKKGHGYKYRIHSRFMGYRVDKADPFAIHAETPPYTASKVWDLDYGWSDQEWIRRRQDNNLMCAPMSIYEMHIGSWRRDPANPQRFLNYREIAPLLSEYVKHMGFTHVELLPVMEHPFYGSWGYQTTGYFAPSSRYGTPQDFMFLVDSLHQAGLGIILDWVPSHFPSDDHGLSYFDGTHLYEHADPRQGFHPDWLSSIFNYGRNEVRSFLMSSACFWLEIMHVDGLRVDAVASMLYLDYSREDGQWIPNQFGGRENLEAVAFLQKFNREIYKSFPGVHTTAEESTDWPMVSRPTYIGGLGFGFKWDMGWMHDTLAYMRKETIHRQYHHNQITFRMLYAFSENFVLPLSHDEVVHGKGSLVNKMPGDDWQKFANLRLLYCYMFIQPGKKLLFMGAELGQWREWSHETSLDWHILEYPNHAGVQHLVRDLNRIYRSEPGLHKQDTIPNGFEWIDCNDYQASVLVIMRKGCRAGEEIIGMFNFTPVARSNYWVGVPHPGRWQEILNSDAVEYWGGGVGNQGGVEAINSPCHGHPFHLQITLPPLSAVLLKAPPQD